MAVHAPGSIASHHRPDFPRERRWRRPKASRNRCRFEHEMMQSTAPQFYDRFFQRLQLKLTDRNAVIAMEKVGDVVLEALQDHKSFDGPKVMTVAARKASPASLGVRTEAGRSKAGL